MAQATEDLETVSSDGTSIHYEVTGMGDPALVFVHGWLGSTRWWDAQRDHFAPRHRIVALDLAGHGRSGSGRTEWSIARYADDVRAVVRAVGAPRVVLVGHSMSGPNALEAALELPSVAGVVLVDTLKNLDRVLTADQARPLVDLYRSDFRRAVEEVLPRHLYAPSTPPAVRARLTAEFLAVPPERAATAIEPLYRHDVRALARQIQVPVRAIVSDVEPVDPAVNRRYFRDYDCVTVAGVGHYPMLERPVEFDAALEVCLRSIASGGGGRGAA
jgi:pimeloyl-ACP methyl ester carboxylesterase